MFSVNHFIWIGISLVIILGLLFVSLKFKFSSRTVLIIMTGIAFASELLKIFTHIDYYEESKSYYISAGSLPLHLCSIFVFLYPFLLFNKNKELEAKLISFFVPIGLFGGLLAILLATSGVNFARPYAYQCFIYHSGMVFVSLYYICTKQVDLGLKAYLRNLIILFALAILMIWVNGALRVYETNFFFVCRPPQDNLPILNLNHGWHVYFLSLCMTGLLLETLVSLPYIIKERRNK